MPDAPQGQRRFGVRGRHLCEGPVLGTFVYYLKIKINTAAAGREPDEPLW
jgi:hypothetical protein